LTAFKAINQSKINTILLDTHVKRSVLDNFKAFESSFYPFGYKGLKDVFLRPVNYINGELIENKGRPFPSFLLFLKTVLLALRIKTGFLFINDISIKFENLFINILEVGHTFMSADSVHGCIGKYIKNCDKIYNFD
jgi:hypothetical protein